MNCNQSCRSDTSWEREDKSRAIICDRAGEVLRCPSPNLLATRTGLSKGYLSDIENGKRKGTLATLRAIGKTL